MRTLIITLLTLTLGLSASAKHRANSQLNIRMADLSNYTVVFNNTTYFATEWVKIYNVPPGKHYLRIEESMQTRGYGMRTNGRRVIYQGWVTVPAGSIVNSRVNFNRNFVVANIFRGNYGYQNGGGYGNHNGQYRNQYPQQPQGGYGQGQGQYGNQQGQYGNQQPQGNGGYDEDEYGQAGDPNTYEYGNAGPDQQSGGAGDDGTYGESQLVAKPTKTTTAKPAVKAPAKLNK